MDLWQLKVFVNVVDQKSFSRAGETIHLSQPTVSSHIKELENYFDCQLIDRLGREALPTKAGELLYLYAKKLLDLKSETESAMSGFIGRLRGTLTVGGSTIPAAYILPKFIAPFTIKFPEVTLKLVSGDTADIIRSIQDGKSEVGIVGAKTEDQQIHQEALIEDEMKLIVPDSHPWAGRTDVSCDMIFNEPFLSREKGSGTWKSITKALINAGFNPEKLNIIAQMGSTASVIQGIMNGAGISILSTIAVEDAIQAGKLVALSVEDLDLKRHFYITSHKKRSQSPIAQKFIEFIKEVLKPEPF